MNVNCHHAVMLVRVDTAEYILDCHHTTRLVVTCEVCGPSVDPAAAFAHIVA